MLNSIAKEFIFKLTQEGFYFPNKDNIFYFENSTDDFTYITLLKDFSGIEYRVTLCNSLKVDFSNYLNHIEKNYTYLNNIETHNCTHYINIHIFLCESENIKMTEYLKTINSFEEQLVNNIFWEVIISKDKYTHIYNKKQPSEILGIYKLLKTCMDNLYNDKTHSKIKPLRKEKFAITCFYIFTLNCLIFIFNLIFNNYLITLGALDYTSVVYKREFYRVISSGFLHYNIMHLFSNSFSLYIFGTRLEKILGKPKFICLYLTTILSSSLLTIIFLRDVISIGSSGGIFGIIGCMIAYTFILKRKLLGLDLYVITIIAIINITIGQYLPYINNVAHVGGLITGIILGAIFCFIDRKF